MKKYLILLFLLFFLFNCVLTKIYFASDVKELEYFIKEEKEDGSKIISIDTVKQTNGMFYIISYKPKEK